ncbi:MBL fold metallo-hydrolase, partial [Candidatus Uhrbacteria bacterium]|nr:MBL fold metallo-hydrolase [Candidatus Uhrbacteria bacterium]
MNSKITFYSGAEEVTGANFLLDTGTTRLLVDCGTREEHGADASTQEPFAYDPRSVDVLLVTHAHQDHIGRIPKLVRDGFRGSIYSTPATRDIAAIMFNDALSLMQVKMEETGEHPAYESRDVEESLSLWQTHEYHEPFDIADMRVEMLDSGHILGAAMMRISRAGRSILFTGDIGNTPEPLLSDTETPSGVQYLVMESVYGDRIHEGREDRKKHLREVIEDTRQRNGILLIPSFSIERTQILLSEINDMVEREHLTPLPVYLDAPLATRVTEVFKRYTGLFNEAAREKITAGDDLFAFKGLTVIDTTRESRALHEAPDPKIIIAGAGMSSGGRIRAHEKAYLGRKDATVLMVGYQAPGSLGRRLEDGAKSVRIDDEWVRVHARIEALTGYSGHADRDQLMDFIENAGESLERAFIVMGEPKSSLFLAQRAKDFLNADTYVPVRGETVTVEL